MTDKEAHDLTHTILKQIQADLAELKQARQEMREGFASIKSHITGLSAMCFPMNAACSILRMKLCV